MNAFELSVQFFLQLAFILAVCRVVGWLARKLGQPQVVGEMIAGVVMGPSLFGWLAPEAQRWMFPPESKPLIFAVCQVGLTLYMFVVGLEFNHSLIRDRLRSAAAVSVSGIAAPFALGALAAYGLMGRGDLFSPRTEPLEAMLFLGAAMAITAFPMLARIIYERRLTHTSLGTLALAAGSVDDAAAWCVLAVVLASFSQDISIAVTAIGGGIAYALFVAFAVRPALRPVARRVERAGAMSPATLSGLLSLLMLGAWFTDRIGIFTVFGAFILGLGVPRGLIANELLRLLEPMTTSLLLPLFFVYSGLNTRITLVNTWDLAGVALVVLGIAVLGKGVACYAAARWTGEPHRDALAVGALMNARGLMELIILNIGLERGVITATLFTIMVIMAIVTTLMASPLFELVYRRGPAPPPAGSMPEGQPPPQVG